MFLPSTRLTSGFAFALLYAVLGGIGLTLAIPPGYASPIFPAAGLALAVALHRGPRVLPFVGLGSFVLNIGHGLLAGHLSGAAVLVAGCIALGASLQAALGQRWVTRRLGDTWQRLESEGQILNFLLWGGVLACLASASVAVTALWSLGLIQGASVPLSWWTWYMGDLLGVVIFAPLALLFLAPKVELTRERRRKIAVPILIALALSMLIYAAAAVLERRQLQARIERDGGAVSRRIQDRLITHQAVLASLAHFAEAHPDYSFQQFETFIQGTLVDNPDVFAFSFNDLVRRDQLQAFEARVSERSPWGMFRATEQDAQHRLVPVGERPDYVVVKDIVPIQGNRPAVGFDIQSEPIRRDAIERARTSGKSTVTAPIHLVQEEAVRLAALLLEPVYRHGRATSSTEPELVGFAVAVLKVDELIGIATRGQIPPGLHFQVRDLQIPSHALPFYGPQTVADVAPYRQWATTLTLADRSWSLALWADDSYVNEGSNWFSWGIGVIALLFTGLLQIYLHGMTGRVLAMRRQNDDLLKKQAELQLAETVFDNSTEAIVVTDAAGNIISINPTFSRITGYSLSDVVGQKMSLLSSGLPGEDFYQGFWQQLVEDKKWQGEMLNRRHNGEQFTALLTIAAVTDPQGTVSQYVGTFSDVTEQKAARRQIEFMAYHDALTELPNRLLGRQRANEAMARARRHATQVGVVFMDLDHFKLVNDTYGHSTGDQLLQAVAQRLRKQVRTEDTLCRISGDEFMLILEDITQAEQIAASCEHVLTELAKPYPIDGRLIQASMSMGISVFPHDGDTTEDLLRKADTAMFEAKQGGRNTYRFFDPSMNQSVVAFVETRDALVQAIQNHEFELYYQPQVRLQDGQATGAEALIRWHHPTKGLLGPQHIISVAEQSGLIVPIGAWVLQQACHQMKTWCDAGLPLQTIAVNLSAIQFRTGNIEQTTLEALTDAGLSPEHLELELTETILISDRDKALDTVSRLKRLGVRLSIDDFGTGYSSMAYLKRFNVDKIKIDASFAADVANDPEDKAIVRSIIQMAQALNMETTAEGIDREDAVQALRQLGCTHIQGYYYARPMPPDAFTQWMRQRTSPSA